jgi:hypothetical protein
MEWINLNTYLKLADTCKSTTNFLSQPMSIEDKECFDSPYIIQGGR